MTLITMSKKEIDRYEIIQRRIRNEINEKETAKILSLSTRQVRRLKAKILKRGTKGLIHGNRGRPSHNKLPEKEKERIRKLLHKNYYDFGPTLASEKLEEVHNIKRDVKTIRMIMTEEGLWKPKEKKKKQKHLEWRERKSSYGEMIQFDGSYEKWFEKRGGTCCLLASIDDATGKITKAKFEKNEGVFPVFRFWKGYIEVNGKPKTVYLDKFSTYKMNHKEAKENEETLTQFERAAKELDIELIRAHSPEAKGRVERLFGTLQDRLIKEMRLENICTMEEANKYLEERFIPKFNNKFGVIARTKINLHRRLKSGERKELESIFSRQNERTVQNDFTISFKKCWYQLLKKQPVTICKKDKVIIEERLDGKIYIRLRRKYLQYEKLAERPKKIKDIPWVLAKTGIKMKKHKPSEDHPWRKFHFGKQHNKLVKIGHF